MNQDMRQIEIGKMEVKIETCILEKEMVNGVEVKIGEEMKRDGKEEEEQEMMKEIMLEQKNLTHQEDVKEWDRRRKR